MGFGQAPRVTAAPGPMQVRFFQEPDVADIETAINAWLAVKPRREIVEVRQTARPLPGGGSDILVSVWYIED